MARMTILCSGRCDGSLDRRQPWPTIAGPFGTNFDGPPGEAVDLRNRPAATNSVAVGCEDGGVGRRVVGDGAGGLRRGMGGFSMCEVRLSTIFVTLMWRSAGVDGCCWGFGVGEVVVGV